MLLAEALQKTYMQQALAQACLRRGFCAPNPAVGAVVVRDQAVLATGTHWASGYPHAERDALNKLKGSAPGATLFVTLEPCCHWGKTPPCTQAIIEAGITQVYYGLLDPNPRVAGQGVAQLETAGVACELCFLPSVRDFYQSYLYWSAHRRPWVTAKLAMSADAKIAGEHGKPVKITGKALQVLTHEYRQKSDAILTTVNTVLNDDPQLNVRLGDQVHPKSIYVLDSALRFPLSAKLFQTSKRLTVFYGPTANTERRLALEAKGVRCVPVHQADVGLSLTDVLAVMGEDGMHDVWLEAGGRCFKAFHEQHLLQRALIYLAPACLGESALDASIRFMALPEQAKTVAWQTYGEELVCDMTFEETMRHP